MFYDPRIGDQHLLQYCFVRFCKGVSIRCVFCCYFVGTGAISDSSPCWIIGTWILVAHPLAHLQIPYELLPSVGFFLQYLINQYDTAIQSPYENPIVALHVWDPLESNQPVRLADLEVVHPWQQGYGCSHRSWFGLLALRLWETWWRLWPTCLSRSLTFGLGSAHFLNIMFRQLLFFRLDLF